MAAMSIVDRDFNNLRNDIYESIEAISITATLVLTQSSSFHHRSDKVTVQTVSMRVIQGLNKILSELKEAEKSQENLDKFIGHINYLEKYYRSNIHP